MVIIYIANHVKETYNLKSSPLYENYREFAALST